MNKLYRFEVVRRFNGRFAWIFVVMEDGRRRVLARSARDYRSRARAEKAIDKMREAPIEPGGLDPEPFPLPTTSFGIVPGVVPLRLDDFPTVFDSRRVATVAAAEPPAPPKKRAAARKPKPRRRRTS